MDENVVTVLGHSIYMHRCISDACMYVHRRFDFPPAFVSPAAHRFAVYALFGSPRSSKIHLFALGSFL